MLTWLPARRLLELFLSVRELCRGAECHVLYIKIETHDRGEAFEATYLMRQCVRIYAVITKRAEALHP